MFPPADFVRGLNRFFAKIADFAPSHPRLNTRMILEILHFLHLLASITQLIVVRPHALFQEVRIERCDIDDLFAFPTLDEHGAFSPIVDIQGFLVEIWILLATESALSTALNLIFRLLLRRRRKLLVDSGGFVIIVDWAVGVWVEQFGFVGVGSAVVTLSTWWVDIGHNCLFWSLVSSGLSLINPIDFCESCFELVFLCFFQLVKLWSDLWTHLFIQLNYAFVSQVSYIL